MLQVNNTIRRKMEWQSVILYIAFDDVTPDASLVHFDHLSHAE